MNSSVFWSPLAPGGHLWRQSIVLLVSTALWIGLLLSNPAATWAANADATGGPASGEDSPPPALANPQPDAGDIPSETVNQFVQTYLDVVDLVEQRESDLRRAETESESLQIQQEIQSEAFALIEAAGLTLSEYWQLLGLANTDADFRERVLAQLDEARLGGND